MDARTSTRVVRITQPRPERTPYWYALRRSAGGGPRPCRAFAIEEADPTGQQIQEEEGNRRHDEARPKILAIANRFSLRIEYRGGFGVKGASRRPSGMGEGLEVGRESEVFARIRIRDVSEALGHGRSSRLALAVVDGLLERSVEKKRPVTVEGEVGFVASGRGLRHRHLARLSPSRSRAATRGHRERRVESVLESVVAPDGVEHRVDMSSGGIDLGAHVED